MASSPKFISGQARVVVCIGDRYPRSDTVQARRGLDAPVELPDERRDDARSRPGRGRGLIAIWLADAVVGNGQSLLGPQNLTNSVNLARSAGAFGIGGFEPPQPTFSPDSATALSQEEA